ncbi:ScbR family autoregulator-binding transcription factor [Parasphingorhabdus pacifica]
MPQQRRAQVTRHAIVVAAAEEFDRVGYDGTPLSAILRRGGVTKGAFYFHFPSKEAVAAELLRFQAQSWSRLRQRWESRGLDPLSTVVGLTGEVTRLLERDVVLRAGTRLCSLPVAAGQPESVDWEQVLHGFLRDAAERGLLHSGVAPEAAARTVHASLVGTWAVGLARDGSDVGVADRIHEVWRLLLGGIATADWLRTRRLSRLLNPSRPR